MSAERHPPPTPHPPTHEFPSPARAFARTVQPVVLVGGRSRRFGRDKLLEPAGGSPLVLRSIDALRGVFGPRVKVVGDCDPRVRTLADGWIDDPYPGRGPLGGIVAALERSPGAVFVLAGDLPLISAATVAAVLERARNAANCLAVLAATDRVHACIGVYQPEAAPVLAARLAAGELRLRTALPEATVQIVPISAREARNVNRPDDAWEVEQNQDTP